MHKREKRTCIVCGRELAPSAHYLAKMCSDKCRRERRMQYQHNWQRRHSQAWTAEQRICRDCGAPLPPGASMYRQLCDACLSPGKGTKKSRAKRKKYITLSQAARMAAELGMTYGQAVAAGKI